MRNYNDVDNVETFGIFVGTSNLSEGELLTLVFDQELYCAK